MHSPWIIQESEIKSFWQPRILLNFPIIQRELSNFPIKHPLLSCLSHPRWSNTVQSSPSVCVSPKRGKLMRSESSTVEQWIIASGEREIRIRDVVGWGEATSLSDWPFRHGVVVHAPKEEGAATLACVIDRPKTMYHSPEINGGILSNDYSNPFKCTTRSPSFILFGESVEVSTIGPFLSLWLCFTIFAVEAR